MNPLPAYDALVLVSFGGPEGPDDVMPFLRNVTSGRNIPPDRLREVASHYEHFGGVSPINAENRALVAALSAELEVRGPALPVYWGNRNWHPLLVDTVRQMMRDGIRRALAFVTSAYGSYSACRQYQDDIARARAEVGANAPLIEKLRLYYNHPGFIEAMRDRTEAALRAIPEEHRPGAHVIFTAHSIPQAMARSSEYEAQLLEASSLVADRLATRHAWRLAYQSRSGPPSVPWLEPDIGDGLRTLAENGVRAVVVVPIGFVSEHMEIAYDLDTEAAEKAQALNLSFARAGTAGSHPAFVSMVQELVQERTGGLAPRALGTRGPAPDRCPEGCCPPMARGAMSAPPRAGARGPDAAPEGARPPRGS